MPGINKTTATTRRTHHQPIQPATSDGVSPRSSKPNPTERHPVISDIQRLLEGLRLSHQAVKTDSNLNGSEIVSSDENVTTSGLPIISDSVHDREVTPHVRLPSAAIRPPHMARLLSKDELKSYAFGWETYPTRATKNEVCRRFLRNQCLLGPNCFRIHPRHGPSPVEAQVLTRTVQDQGYINRKQVSRMPAGRSAGGTPPQDSFCDESSPKTEAVSEFAVKLPSKIRKIAPLESFPFTVKSNNVLGREGNDDTLPNSPARDPPDEASSSNRSLSGIQSTLTHFPFSVECNGPDSGFQTSLGGYRASSNRTSDGNTSDSSIFSSSISPSSQSSFTEDVPCPMGRDQLKAHPPPKYSEFCRNWLLQKCYRGYRCLYVHGDLKYDPPAQGRHPPPRYAETCHRWLRNECTYGYTCHFVHGDLEYDLDQGAVPTRLNPTPTIPAQHEPKAPSTDGGTIVNKRPPPSRAPASPLSVTIHDHAKVKLTAGFDIKDIVTGFETHWVFLGNIPVHVTAEDIKQLLQPFGRTMDVKWGTRARAPTKTARVRLSTPAEARQACITLDDAQAFGTTINARLPVNDSQKSTIFDDTAVRVQWSAPSKVAYGGYSTMERANRAIEATRIPFRDHLITASIHVGLPVVGVITVRFRGVPLGANEGDMERFAHPDDVVWERPNYLLLPRAIHGIKQILEEDAELLSFEVLPPPYRNGATICAWAHFPTPSNAKAACGRLHGRRPMFTGKTLVFARHVRCLSYSLSPIMHAKLDNDIQLLRRVAWFRSRTTISVVMRNPSQPILVKLSGEDLKELGQLKSEFEKVLNGEVVRQDGKVAWDGFFARPAGHIFITELESANPGVTIQSDDHRQMIRLLGSAQNRGKVREKLFTKLHELRSQRIRTLPLDGRLIGLFMSKDLMLLRQELGFENVNLDIRHRNLQIRGNDVAYDAAEEAVRRARSRHPAERRSNAIECPVCFDQVTTPVTLPCGHAWCRACLKNYLVSSIDNKYFPLTCLGSEAKCTEPMPLNLAREILAVSEFDAVVNAAFSTYVQSRPDEFHYCPSPDCPQIYRTAARNTVLRCPSCLIRLCPNCHVEAHDGFVCPESGDSLFQEWMKNHDVKTCPGCKIPIERAEGCNHMTCTQCQTHICWVCLHTFPRGEGIYDHMRSVHGGIGLGPIF